MTLPSSSSQEALQGNEQMVRTTNSRTFAGRGYTLFLGLNKSAEELGIKSHNYFIYDTADTAKQYDLMRKVDTNHVQATVCLNNAWPGCSPKGTCMMYFTTMFMSDDWGSVEDAEWDSLMPRMMMMKEDAQLFPILHFAGGWAMRSSRHSCAYVSDDLSGRQTVGDLKREVR